MLPTNPIKQMFQRIGKAIINLIGHLGSYCAWSLRQFYMLLFQPSVFKKTVEGPEPDQPKLRFSQRSVYLTKLVPWIAVQALIGNLIVGFICVHYQIDYFTYDWWQGIVAGVIVGLFFGLASGVANGVAFAVAVGIAGGMCFTAITSTIDGGEAGSFTFFGLLALLATTSGVIIGFRRRASDGSTYRASDGSIYSVAIGVTISIIISYMNLHEYYQNEIVFFDRHYSIYWILVTTIPSMGFITLIALFAAQRLKRSTTLKIAYSIITTCVALLLIIFNIATARQLERQLFQVFFAVVSTIVISGTLGTQIASRQTHPSAGISIGFTLFLVLICMGALTQALNYLNIHVDHFQPLSLATVGVVLFGLAFGIILNFISGMEVSPVIGLGCGVLYALLFFLPGFYGMPLEICGLLCITAVGIFWVAHFRLITYPSDAIFTALRYYLAQRQPEASMDFWKRAPVVWNEVIWLPLPLVDKFLALMVQRDRDEGFRQITWVAAERRHQRRQARRALVEVIIHDLTVNNVSEIAQVSAKLDWATDSPMQLPNDLATVVPRFDRISQHVSQYCKLNSMYLKSVSLAAAKPELESLQQSLVATHGTNAPRLLQKANAWKTIIEDELVIITERAREEKEIPNPFAFGNPIAETEHAFFTGRQEIVDEIAQSILNTPQTPTLLLYGPRRMGKTSILNQLPRLLGPEFAPTLLDCQNPAVTANLPTFLRYFSRKVSEGLRRRNISIQPLEEQSLQQEPYSVLDNWLDRVEQAMPGQMRALICLDEYERLQLPLDAGWGEALFDALRHIIQHRPRIIFLFSGAHTFADLGPKWTNRFIHARQVRVSFLHPDEITPLLTRPIPEFNMEYEQGALDRIISTTNGQPFLTQAVAFELVQWMNKNRRRVATIPDVEQAIEQALDSGSPYFANVWSDAGQEGQEIMLSIARGDTPTVQGKGLTWLIRNDILLSDDRFAVPMMERWVKTYRRES